MHPHQNDRRASGSRFRVGLAVAVTLVATGAVAVASGTSTGATAASSATNLKRLPLGDGRVSTTTAKRGWVYACSAGNPSIGGAFKDGPWIDTKNKVFDETKKSVVDGSIDWPSAKVTFTKSSSGMKVAGNGLPTNRTTGVFPIASSDDAYQYDRNPNTISSQSVSWTLPVAKAAAKATCLSGGPIGIALNGVEIFDALDGMNRDAVAHETQDACQGHPERSGAYHYHSMPVCLWKKQSSTTQSSQFGWARDGYPIYGPRGAGGKLMTNANLDKCHGTTSTVTLNGKRVRTYHYVATLEYPYTLGCFHGTPLRSARP
jgi:YHYH protein